jgi:hypothetical protein
LQERASEIIVGERSRMGKNEPIGVLSRH